MEYLFTIYQFNSENDFHICICDDNSVFILIIYWMTPRKIGHALNFEWDVAEENEISMVYDSRVKGIKILIS